MSVNLECTRRLGRMEGVLRQRTDRLVIVCENFADVFNLSAVLRSADSFGVQEVWCVNPRDKREVARLRSKLRNLKKRQDRKGPTKAVTRCIKHVEALLQRECGGEGLYEMNVAASAMTVEQWEDSERRYREGEKEGEAKTVSGVNDLYSQLDERIARAATDLPRLPMPDPKPGDFVDPPASGKQSEGGEGMESNESVDKASTDTKNNDTTTTTTNNNNNNKNNLTGQTSSDEQKAQDDDDAERLKRMEASIITGRRVLSDKVHKGVSRYVSVRYFRNSQYCLQACKQQGLEIWASTLSSKARPFNSTHFPPKRFLDPPGRRLRIAMVLGRELDGVSPVLLSHATEHVYIPMYGFSESFNVSVACALMLQTMFQLWPSIRGSLYREAPEACHEVRKRWLRQVLRKGDKTGERLAYWTANPEKLVPAHIGVLVEHREPRVTPKLARIMKMDTQNNVQEREDAINNS